MKNYHHIKHPLIALTLLGIAISWIAIFYVEGVLGMAGTSCLEVIGGWGTNILGENNWPHVLAGIVWVSGFSVSVCGLLVNIMEWARYPGIDMNISFDAIKTIDPADAKEIMAWLKNSDFDIKDMKQFVGYV